MKRFNSKSCGRLREPIKDSVGGIPWKTVSIKGFDVNGMINNNVVLKSTGEHNLVRSPKVSTSFLQRNENARHILILLIAYVKCN